MCIILYDTCIFMTYFVRCFDVTRGKNFQSILKPSRHPAPLGFLGPPVPLTP